MHVTPEAKVDMLVLVWQHLGRASEVFYNGLRPLELSMFSASRKITQINLRVTLSGAVITGGETEFSNCSHRNHKDGPW